MTSGAAGWGEMQIKVGALRNLWKSTKSAQETSRFVMHQCRLATALGVCDLGTYLPGYFS